ncbi:MAG: hypothetical protein ACTHM6_02855, partial [Tepidisphaeraceae bacterium]
DLPGLRKRWKETDTGRRAEAALHRRLADAIKPGSPARALYDALVAGDTDAAMTAINAHPNLLGTVAHYQFYMPTVITWQALDALVNENESEGKAAAAALTTWAKLIRPYVDRDLDSPMNDDVFRIAAMPNVGDAPKGTTFAGRFRELLGYHLVGYAYDFAYNFMDDAQRSTVRSLIAKATAGRLWMGARLPHHFRNWNWIEIGLSQPLLSLAIEGEDGYDPRVFKLGCQIAQDYFTYGITAKGTATEAVGYMNFGLVWGNPFAVAAQRRGETVLTHSHYRALADWYVQCYQPGSAGFYQSHGDGGDTGPQPWTLSVWRYFFPTDPRVDFLWQNYVRSVKGDPFGTPFHLIEPLLFACDGPADSNGKPVDYADGAALHAPLTDFDPTRSSLMTRSAWSPTAAAVQFECRTDSVGASHEHADRGNFTFSALGRSWAREYFRSVETKFHNCVLIDGIGQGYWPGPGKWLGLKDSDWALTAACDAKDAYGWWWPKQIVSEDPKSFVRFQFPRWAGYLAEAQRFHANYGQTPLKRDPRPSVKAHWAGFLDTDPRMWDEDSWPVRLPFNPVQRAFRTIAFVRGPAPYMVVVDDLQKDDRSHLYEWLMMPGADTELLSAKGNDVTLGDIAAVHDADGIPKPKAGDRELLVRVLNMAPPATAGDWPAKPAIRLETFERQDTLTPDGRSFGVDKRLVIPCRAVAPDFKILLFPHLHGQPVPKTTWNADQTELTIELKGQTDHLHFTKQPDGRTHVELERQGSPAVELE